MDESKKIDPKLHKGQVVRYAREKKQHYDKYAEILEAIFKKACESYAPHGIVQARPKSISGFAEKLARKGDKYKNPLRDITDLCGARVIVNTIDEVGAFCRFIEDHFDIDQANSLDAK